jgi:hypothetical protein
LSRRTANEAGISRPARIAAVSANVRTTQSA